MAKAAGSNDGGKGRSVADTARDHVRAAAGGLLVGLPLLWTMEMWDAGAVLPPAKLLLLLGIAFLVVIGYNAIAGFRRERTIVELVVDATQGLGVSVVLAAAALAVLGRLDLALGPQVLVGRVALLAIPVAFGTSLAATLLSDREDAEDREPVSPLGRLLVAGGGALYFALNVAPTEEVRIIGTEATPTLLLAAVVVGLAIGHGLVFAAGLPGGRASERRAGASPVEGPLAETIATYAVALGVAWFMIWAFGSADGASPRVIVGEVVMLGILASFGAATSRLLVGASDG
jgi:putative integral membrane protein (TIGR02587 family)